MKNHIAPCGVDCNQCPAYEKECIGCNEVKGKAEWVPDIGLETCPLYQCSVNEHHYRTCAECEQVPCQKFREMRDPSMSDEEFVKSIQDRLEVLENLRQPQG